MSQIYKTVSSTPSVPTTFNADLGSAVPDANILIIDAADTSVNNDNGIRTIAGVGQGLLANEVQVQLTNRITGLVSTTNATPTTIITFDLGATAGAYSFMGYLEAFNSTTPAASSYRIKGGARTTGAAGTEIGIEVENSFKETALADCDVSFSIVGNNAILTVTGIALNITWNALIEYRFTGVA